MTKKIFSKWLAISVVALAVANCGKDDSNNEPTPPSTIEGINLNQEEAKKGYMVLQTDLNALNDKKRGKIKGHWRFSIYVNEEKDKNIWIDLNNNAIKDEGEEVEAGHSGEGEEVVSLRAISDKIVIYGKVSLFVCPDNQLTSLDVSKNINLTILVCPDNQLTSLDVSKTSI